MSQSTSVVVCRLPLGITGITSVKVEASATHFSHPDLSDIGFFSIVAGPCWLNSDITKRAVQILPARIRVKLAGFSRVSDTLKVRGNEYAVFVENMPAAA